MSKKVPASPDQHDERIPGENGRLILTLADRSGRPITAKAKVFVKEEAPSGSREYRAEGKAGQVTRFVFDIPPHIYSVQVWAEGYEVYSQFVTVRTGQKSIFEFRLKPKRDEDEKEEGEAELVRGRFESFIRERVDTGKDFPSDARLKALRQKKRMNDPDVTNSSLKVEAVANPLPGSSFGDIDAYVKVEPKSVRDGFHRSLLKIPYDKKKLGWVDETSLRVFQVDSEKRQFHLIRDSGVDAARGYAIAYVEKPGVYGVIGLPKHRAVLETVRLFTQFQEQLLVENRLGLKTLHNRLCELILCAADFDSSHFAGDEPPICPGGFPGNVCDFCFGIDMPAGGLPEGGLNPPGAPPGGPIVVPGCNWFSIGPRNINGRIRAMAIHPTDGNTVYAGSANAGVWVTNDAGESWRALMEDQAALEIGAVAAHLTDPALPAGAVTIYAGTGEPTSWPGYAGIGVLKSTDSGANWSLTGAIGNERFSAILIAPHSVTNNPATTVLYAGGTPGGLYKSIDGGANWTLVFAKDISGLAMDPGDPADNTVYAAVAFEGIYKSTDGGGIWNLFNAGFPAGFPRLILIDIGKSAPNKMYAKLDEAVYAFDTGTMTWLSLGNHGSTTYGYWNNVLGVDPQDSNIVYAAGIGMERSFDGGTNWAWVPVIHGDEHAIVFDSTNHLNVYVGDDGGVFRGVYTSAASAGSWSKASDGLLLTQFNHVGVSEAGPNVVGGGTQDNGTNRTLGGLTWDHIAGADGGFFVIDPVSPYIIYAETQNGGLMKSTDGGVSFAGSGTGFPGGDWVTPIVLDPTSPPEPNRVLFAGGNSEVYRSTNSAGLWTASSPGLGGAVEAIALAPASSAIVYAGTSIGGVWRSSDNGATLAGWVDITVGTVAGSVTLPQRLVKDIAVHPTNPNILFVTFSGFDTSTPLTPGHVFSATSTDGGVSWRWDNISSNLPDTPVNAVAVDPATTNTLYVGTDIGVFRTADGGLSWADFDAGLPNVVIADLAINAAGDKLRAATYGYGMFELHLGGGCPDVDIYVRDNKLDTGESVPSPSGVLDPSTVGANVYWWESADIKVDAFPYLPPDVLFDGVEFDTSAGEDVVRNDASHPNPNHLYVQAHNRGALTAHNVKVKVLWADASAGLPPLPSDFWSNYPNDWAAASAWQTVDPAVPFQNISQLLPHTPKVLMWSWTVPTTAAEHTCMLAVISSDEDAVTRSDAVPNDHLVWIVVPNDKHVTLRNLHVITAPAPPPGGAPSPMASTIDFHNPFPFPQHFDIELDQPEVSRALRLSLLLPEVQTQVPLTRSLGTGIEVSAVTGKEDWWAKLKGIHQKLFRHHCLFDHERLEHGCDRKQPHIPQVLIPAGGRLRATLLISPPPDAKPGSTFRFTIRQLQGSTLIGGSTYEVRIPLPGGTIVN